MADHYLVSSSPHVRQGMTTRLIMALVLCALAPAALFGIIHFGVRALLHILITVCACGLSETLFCMAVKKKPTVSDLSFAVTGCILAMNLPVSAPLWIGALGGAFAIVVVKMLFGGLGQNFMNPALGARCFLLISFAGLMTNFSYDGFTGATPLAILKEGGSVPLLDLFLGTTAGTIGETSALCLMIGGIFLIVFRIIDFRIPVSYLLTFACWTLLIGGRGLDFGYMLSELCAGGLMFGAFFMATDYVTTPVTPLGRVLFGILVGTLNAVFRFVGTSVEGCSYAILFGNLLVPLIERITIPRAFGLAPSKGGKK